MIDKTAIGRDMLYHPLSIEIATERMNSFTDLIQAFMEKCPLSDEELEWSSPLLLKIIERVDQRSDYFTYFHSKTDKESVEVEVMSQYKEISLMCFWILKYKPLRIKSTDTDLEYYARNHCGVNEAFAAYLFVSQICTSDKVSKEQKTYYRSPEFLRDLFYKFMHHDISKEAMIFSLTSVVCCK